MATTAPRRRGRSWQGCVVPSGDGVTRRPECTGSRRRPAGRAAGAARAATPWSAEIGAGRCPRRRSALAGNPEATAALRRAGLSLAGARLLAGPRRNGSRAGRLAAALPCTRPGGARAGRSARAGARRRGLLTADPHVRELQLGERLADRGGLLRTGGLLDERQQRPHPLDRKPHLRRVALVLGPRLEAGAPHPHVDEGDELLEQDLVDADLLELRLVGGAELLLGGLAGGAHGVFSSCPVVSDSARRARDRGPPESTSRGCRPARARRSRAARAPPRSSDAAAARR